MEAKKLPLLIALVALIGTFTSVIPQSTFATDESETAFCDIIPSPNTDTHSLVVVKNGANNVDVVATYRASTNPDDNQVGDLARTNLLSYTLFSLDIFDARTFVDSQGAINDPPTIPRIFTAMFNALADGEYIVFECGDEVVSNELPFPNFGTHHGDSARFRIDTTDPTISCSPLNFAADVNDLQTIPRDDARFDDFFGVDVVVNDNLDDNLVVTDNAPDDIPVDQIVSVTFTVTDDDGNFATATCDIFIEPFRRAGCEGRTLDTNGEPLEIEVCEEVAVRQAECGLGILGVNPTLPYGALNQGETSAPQSLFVINTGNAPALLKVIAGDPLASPPTLGAWIDPNQVGAPPFTPQMVAGQTHFSTLDPVIVGPTDAAFYDSGDSFAVSDTDKKILIPIFLPQVIEELFWQLRILLLNPLFFGDLQQTLTLELQQCSLANECEQFGFDCPLTGDTFFENG